MPHDIRRADRVAAAIREEVATFLTEGVKDPRVVGLVTVTGVDVTQDLRYAKIFVSIMGTDEERKTTFEGLSSLAPYVRTRLAKVLRLRFAPEIEFRNDPTIEHAARIETLLAQLRNNQPPSDDEAGH